MQKNLVFHQIEPIENLSEALKDSFNVDLQISGGWGYDNKNPVIVHNLHLPIDHFLHMFATIRSTIEMNLMQNEGNRFSGINVTFVQGEQFEIENKIFDHIVFEVSAMNEILYSEFIKEYKENYGKNKDFDMNDHFKRRKQNTIVLQSDFWFVGLEKFYYNELS